jgi:hypothetical protein
LTRFKFAALLEAIQEAERKVNTQGQDEYARSEEDCFSNFKRVGDWLNLDQRLVLLVYALKHLDGIVAHVEGHTSQREDVRGRIKDLRLYLAILWGMENEINTSN